MSGRTIIVPVDGTSNIKLEVFDFETLAPLYSVCAPTPVREVGGLHYNATGKEFAWFDGAILALPDELKRAAVIAPVARGASGGLIGRNNTLIEVPGEALTLSYTQRYSDEVEECFRELAGDPESFFLETGSIRDFPGSLTLIKRLVFEETERPELLERAAAFGTYGILMSGHFLGNDYLRAWNAAGNEHSYWMCHTGARDIREAPGIPSSAARKIASFGCLVPQDAGVAYHPVGVMPPDQVSSLGLPDDVLVTPGGHDTCISHIPIMSTFFQSFPGMRGNPVIQVEAGSWTMVARIGGCADLPSDGWRRDILVQGTVDGEPVATARYGGGNDFREAQRIIEAAGGVFSAEPDDRLMERIVGAAEAFVLPNISPINHGTGPFPDLRGRIINEPFLLAHPGSAHIATSIATSLAAAVQIEAVSGDRSVPLVITAGGAKDSYYGRLLATFTGHTMYAPFDRNGSPVTETTSLGAAITGKAACLGIHPYLVDTGSLGIEYRKVEPYRGEIARKLAVYRERWMEMI
jgi:hypothetical protein